MKIQNLSPLNYNKNFNFDDWGYLIIMLYLKEMIRINNNLKKKILI